MLLSDIARAYIAAQNAERPIGKELSTKTCEHLFGCIAVYSRYLCRSSCLSDFNAEVLNAFLTSLIIAGRSEWTVKNRRTGLLVLWRFACRQGWAGPCIGVRPVRPSQHSINGYSIDQMTAFTAYVKHLRGVVRNTGIPKAIYWDSFLRTKWEVGLRIGDMLRVDIPHFDISGWLWTEESKTGKCGWRRLRLSTTESIAACIAARPSRQRIWPGFKIRNAYRAFKELAKRAGVNGTSRYVRSGGSSEYDRLHPGQGWRFLRHSSPQVWERHYRVDRICDQDELGPPEIPKAG